MSAGVHEGQVMDTYDPADNSAKSYALAIETMRQKLDMLGAGE